MTRLSNLPDISKLIQDIEREQREMKQAQTVGASSINIETTVSGFITATIPSGTYWLRTVTFTADIQDNAFVELAYEVFNGGTDSGQKDDTVFIDISRYYSTDPRQTIFRLSILNTSIVTQNYFVRLYAQSTDSGAFT